MGCTAVYSHILVSPHGSWIRLPAVQLCYVWRLICCELCPRGTGRIRDSALWISRNWSIRHEISPLHCRWPVDTKQEWGHRRAALDQLIYDNFSRLISKRGAVSARVSGRVKLFPLKKKVAHSFPYQAAYHSNRLHWQRLKFLFKKNHKHMWNKIPQHQKMHLLSFSKKNATTKMSIFSYIFRSIFPGKHMLKETFFLKYHCFIHALNTVIFVKHTILAYRVGMLFPKSAVPSWEAWEDWIFFTGRLHLL